MKVLIIGFGSIGQRHYRILNTHSKINECHVVTKQTNLNMSTFKNLEDVELERYDYFIIASETSLHFSQLQYIIQKVERKIILVEKPIFSKIEKNLFYEKNLNKIYVAYNRRYYPIIQKIKELIKEETPYSINVITGQYLPYWRLNRDYRETYSAKRSKGGGVLLDLSHEIDYIQYLFGEMNIKAAINAKISDLDIDSDDYCTVIAQSDRIIISFSIDYISKMFIQKIVIHTKNISIFANLKKMKLKVVNKKEEIKKYSFKKYSKDYSFLQMHNDLLFNKSTQCCNYKEGLNVLQKIYDIKRLSQ